VARTDENRKQQSPVIHSPQAEDIYNCDAVPINVAVTTDNAVCCIYITARGKPAQVLSSQIQTAVGKILACWIDVGNVSGDVDLYVCESSTGGCAPTPDPNKCPCKSITLTCNKTVSQRTCGCGSRKSVTITISGGM
jgi:hypothetical protein